MIYLDTHAVVWLKAGKTDWVSPQARKLCEKEELRVSPLVLLELQMLFEKGRVKDDAQSTMAQLTGAIGAQVCELPFLAVIRKALAETWTRDPFDRLIVAQARANNAYLLTADEAIRKHYKKAVQ